MEKWMRKMATPKRRVHRRNHGPRVVGEGAGARAAGRSGGWVTVALLMMLLVAGCGSRSLKIPTSLEELQNFNVNDVQVTDLTIALGENLAAYNSQYAVRPRRGDTPLAIAEAYLREYQPG